MVSCDDTNGFRANQMRVALQNPATGELKDVKVGWSWTLFLFSGFLGIPLFMRRFHLLGLVYVAYGPVFFMCGLIEIAYPSTAIPIGYVLLLITSGLFVLSTYLAINGNEMTAKKYLALGWVFADPNSDGVAYALDKWSRTAAPPWGVPGFRWPWMTIAMNAMFIAGYVCEVVFGFQARGNPSPATAIALGGLSRICVEEGEVYRLLTWSFLHVGPTHLIANLIAFTLTGYYLERALGRAWMPVIFLAGSLAGAAVSLATNKWMASVGASGGIMAMQVALFAVSLRLPRLRTRITVQILTALMAVPTLFPDVIPVGNTMHIDSAGHFGGAIAGLSLGAILLLTWPRESRLPRFGSAANAVAIAGAALLLIGVGGIVAHYPSYEKRFAELIPQASLPTQKEDIVTRADGLLAAYPSDPRAHLLVAFKYVFQEAATHRDDLNDQAMR